MNEESEFDELAPWIVILITLIGAGMRIFLLENKGLRLEESLSMWLSTHSGGDIWQWVVKIDQHPPLYYLLLHYWTAIKGVTIYTIRLPSALLSAGTIPMIYLIGKRLSGVAVGLAAAIFLAISPFNIRFAQEARMYTLLMFNASVAIYALVRLLTDPRSSRPIGSQFRDYLHTWHTSEPASSDTERDFSYADRSRVRTGWRAWIYRHYWSPIQTIETDLAWVAFIIFSAATMLSDNTGILLPLATNFFVLCLMLFQRKKDSGTPPTFQAPSFWNWLKAQIVIFLLWCPWIVGFINQASRVYHEFWIPRPGWDTILQAARSLLYGSSPVQGDLVVAIWLLLGLMLCFGLVYFRKKFSRFLFLVALFIIPFIVELFVSIFRPVFLDRTLIWTTIPLIIVLSAGIAQLRFRLFIVIGLGILGAINLFSASDYYRSIQVEDWNHTAGFVAKYVQNGDLILFNATRNQIPFDYYFEPYVEKYLLKIEEHGMPVDLFASGTLEPKMTESDVPRLISLLSGHKTVWLLYSQNMKTDPIGLIPQTLASEMRLVGQRDFYGVQVQIYAAP
jgi:mannosyltransferase